MELLRKELKLFASATESMLSHGVKLEELTEMEQYLIQYYLAAMTEKYPILDQNRLAG